MVSQTGCPVSRTPPTQHQLVTHLNAWVGGRGDRVTARSRCGAGRRRVCLGRRGGCCRAGHLVRGVRRLRRWGRHGRSGQHATAAAAALPLQRCETQSKWELPHQMHGFELGPSQHAA